jgi:O-antigen/teichoic acid export membrane protein
VLNVISLAAMAYIVRTLGPADYGKFSLAISFVGLLMPLTAMGLRALTVRDVALDRPGTSAYAARMLACRLLLAVLTTGVGFAALRVLGYDELTRLTVQIACLNFLIMSVTNVFHDVFEAHEAMRPVATSLFVGGIVLTPLSVLALFAGTGILGLMATYVFGSLVTMLVAGYQYRRLAGPPKVQWDRSFFADKIRRGGPFFYPNIVNVACQRTGFILLSLMAGDSAVGFVAAGSTLVDKLQVIPEGITMAIYPTLVVLNRDAPERAQALFKKYMGILMIIGLPIAVGTMILAEPILRLIFGVKYSGSANVMRLQAWWLITSSLASLMSATLTAIGQERAAGRIAFFSAPLYVALNALFIPFFGPEGVVVANLIASIVNLALFGRHIRRSFTRTLIPWDHLARIVLVSLLMGIVVFFLRNAHVLVGISVGAATYAALALILRLVTLRDLRRIRRPDTEVSPP